LTIRTRDDARTPLRLRLDRRFCPCPIEPGDEFFANGIFEFNITRLFDFLQAHPKRFPIEAVELANIPSFVDVSYLNKATVDTADVFKPVLLAEISPGRYNLIDGQHRVARARRENLVQIAAYRVSCPDHVAFLPRRMRTTSATGTPNSQTERQGMKSQVPEFHAEQAIWEMQIPIVA